MSEFDHDILFCGTPNYENILEMYLFLFSEEGREFRPFYLHLITFPHLVSKILWLANKQLFFPCIRYLNTDIWYSFVLPPRRKQNGIKIYTYTVFIYYVFSNASFWSLAVFHSAVTCLCVRKNMTLHFFKQLRFIRFEICSFMTFTNSLTHFRVVVQIFRFRPNLRLMI